MVCNFDNTKRRRTSLVHLQHGRWWEREFRMYTVIVNRPEEQEAPLSQRDRATRRVSWNRAKSHTNVPRIAFVQSCNRPMTFKVIQGH